MPQCISPIASLVLAAAAASVAPAQAQSASAQASLAQLAFELVDLDPNDGITPAMHITSTQTRSQSSYGTSSMQIEDDTIYAAGTSSVTRSFGQATTSGGADPWTSAASYTDPSLPNVYFKSWNLTEIHFTLTPYSELLVTAEVSVDASDAGGISAASSKAYFSGWLNAELLYNFCVNGTYAYDTSVSRSIGGRLQSGAEAVTGGLGLVTEAVVQLSPVPEPASVAMLLAGLAVVGASVQGRRRRGA